MTEYFTNVMLLLMDFFSLAKAPGLSIRYDDVERAMLAAMNVVPPPAHLSAFAAQCERWYGPGPAVANGAGIVDDGSVVTKTMTVPDDLV